MYAQPTAGLAEIEPSMEWNPSVVSGVGVVADVTRLYADMHSYLSSSGAPALREGPTPDLLAERSTCPQLLALRHGMAARCNSYGTHVAWMQALQPHPTIAEIHPGSASADGRNSKDQPPAECLETGAVSGSLKRKL